MRSAIIKQIHEFMQKDKNIYFLTGDLGYGTLEEIEKDFPDRFINMGIAEQNMIGVAAGLAASGKKVYLYSIIPFITMRCFEQIRNDLCYHDLPVTILGAGSGLSYGVLGATHFALEDISILRPLPNMRVFSPADETEAVLGIDALRNFPHPLYVRIGKKKENTVYDKPYHFRFGKGVTLMEGDNLAIFTTGTITYEVLEAVKRLKNKNIKAALVNLHTLKPLDEKLILEVSQNKKLAVTVEEHYSIGGLAEAVAGILARTKKHPPLLSIAVPNRFLPFIGTQEYLRDRLGLSAKKIEDFIYRQLA